MKTFAAGLQRLDNEKRRAALSTLPRLLIERKRTADIERLLTDLTFIQAKLKAGLGNELADNFATAVEVLSEVDEGRSPFGDAQLNHVPEWIAGATASVLRGDADSAVPDGTGRLRSELRALSPTQRSLGFCDPPTLPDNHPLDDEVFGGDVGTTATLRSVRAAEAAAESDETPVADTPLGHLESMAAFVSTEGPLLRRYPEETVPAAYNSAEAGCVPDAATPLIGEIRRPWLRRTRRAPWQPSSPLLMGQLREHAESVRAVVISADGRRIISGDGSGVLLVWDAPRGTVLHRLRKKDAEIGGIAVTPDARRAVSFHRETRGRQQFGFYVWDMADGELICEGGTEFAPVRGVGISADGTVVASLHEDERIRIWRAANASLVRHFDDPDYRLTDPLRLSLDGGLVTCIVNEKACPQPRFGIAVVWDTATGQRLRVLEGHRHYLTDLQFAGDGRLLLTSSADNSVCLWDLRSGANLRRIVGLVDTTGDLTMTDMSGNPTDRIQAFACSADGRAVFCISECSKFATLFDSKTDEYVRRIGGHSSLPQAVAMSADARIGVTAVGDVLHVWNLGSGIEAKRPPGHGVRIRKVELRQAGKIAFTTAANDTMGTWDTSTGKNTRGVRCKGGLRDASCSSDGSFVLSGASELVTVIDLQETVVFHDIQFDEQTPVERLGIAPNSRIGVVYSRSFQANALAAQLHVVHLPSAEVTHVVPLELETAGELGWMSFTPNSTICLVLLKTASSKSTLLALDCESGQLILRRPIPFEVSGCSLSPDCRMIALACSDLSVQVWELNRDLTVCSLWRHTDTVSAIAFTPDGRSLTTGGNDGSVCVWNVRSFQLKSWSRDVHGEVAGIVPSACGRFFVSVDTEGMASLWETETGRIHARYAAHATISSPDGGSACVAGMSASGKLILGDHTGQLHILDLCDDELGPAICTATGDQYTCLHCGQVNAVPRPALDVIAEQQRRKPVDSPILTLPMSAWDDTVLSCRCASCDGAIRLNPFRVGEIAGSYTDGYSQERPDYLTRQTGYALAETSPSTASPRIGLEDCRIPIQTDDGPLIVSGEAISDAECWGTFTHAGPPCPSCGRVCDGAAVVRAEGWICADCIVGAIKNCELAASAYNHALRHGAPLPCRLLVLLRPEQYLESISASGPALSADYDELIDHLGYQQDHPLDREIRVAAIAACHSIGLPILKHLVERRARARLRSEVYFINLIVAVLEIEPSGEASRGLLEEASRHPSDEVRRRVPVWIRDNIDSFLGDWVERVLQRLANDESDLVRTGVREAHELFVGRTKQDDSAPAAKPPPVGPISDDLVLLPWSACVAFGGRCARLLHARFAEVMHRDIEYAGWLHRAVVAVSDLAAGTGQTYRDEALLYEVSDASEAMIAKRKDAEIAGNRQQLPRAACAADAAHGILAALKAAATERSKDAAIHVAQASDCVVRCAQAVDTGKVEEAAAELWQSYYNLNNASLSEGWHDNSPIGRSWFGERELPPEERY